MNAIKEFRNPLTKPLYLPGDIVRFVHGGFGLIEEAVNIINGSAVKWNEEWPKEIKHMCPPHYSVQKIPGLEGGRKGAWWYENEIAELIDRGPIHKYSLKGIFGSEDKEDA